MTNKLILAASLFMATVLMTSTASAAWFDQDRATENKATEQPMSGDRLEIHEEDATLQQHDDMEPTPFAERQEAEESEMMTVDLDILPEDDSNEINKQRNQPIEVAILGSNEFDVRNVDTNSITLADAQGNGNFRVEDVNDDGVEDLVGEFDIAALNLEEDEQELKLKGQTKDGKSFKGTDSVTLAAADIDDDDDDEMQS